MLNFFIAALIVRFSQGYGFIVEGGFNRATVSGKYRYGKRSTAFIILIAIRRLGFNYNVMVVYSVGSIGSLVGKGKGVFTFF